MFHLPKQNGFSLLELLVVLMLISVLGAIAIRSTVDIGYSARYEQTREHLESIRTAIIGNPKRTINGQPDISGFVADMGRLPVNLRELVDQNYCTVNRTIDETAYDSSLYGSAQAHCDALAAGAWKTQAAASTDTTSSLKYGWRGPYLSVSESVLDADLYTDGWGREAQNATDFDYGWRFGDGYDLSTATPHITDPDRLVVQSYGKDYAAGGTDYDEDYPVNSLSATDIAPYDQPAPLVDKDDWLVDISGGISATLRLPLNGTRQIAPVSFCTDSSKTTKTVCTSPAVWFGGCEDQSYYNKSSCKTALGTGKWINCSLGVTYSDKQTCETDGGVWFGEGFGCEDQTQNTKTSCVSAGKVWRSCTDDGTISTQSTCTAANQLWYGDVLITTGSNGGCNDIHYTNKTSCVNAGKTWQSCSIVGQTTPDDCRSAGGYWLGNGYGCSNQQYSNRLTCESSGGSWVESWPRCYKTTAPDIESIVPYRFIKTNKAECENDISGVWTYPSKDICMNVFYRNNGAINFASSSAILIKEHGGYQTLQFNNFNVSPIPIGINAIGIYEYDGDCNTDNAMYPSDRTQPIQVMFISHNDLPVINW
nr:prepilin-type N-terminal cleavage/methylation domain-containing protein [Methylomarinum sp. Ch1-1]MDP4519461.1 prepilin-type N-terminal cleavage/methylation domain-containing protein [Methylomarinum sp. Ch1-1]